MSHKTINCDQVVWILDIFDRYLPISKHPNISKEREMMKYGMLYELMEVGNILFENDGAVNNATPPAVRGEGWQIKSSNPDKGKP